MHVYIRLQGVLLPDIKNVSVYYTTNVIRNLVQELSGVLSINLFYIIKQSLAE